MPTIREMERTFDLGKYLKKFNPKESGYERIVDCPECVEKGKKQKLWINIKKKQGICYYCDVSHKSVIDIIQFLEKLPLQEAIRVLELGSSDSTRNLSVLVGELLDSDLIEKSEEVKPKKITLPASFVSYQKAKKIPKYFNERGITRKQAIRYGLGFCTSGYYFNRLIVPAYMNQKLVSFQARYMKKEPPEGIKKTLFPLGAKTNHILFNYDTARLQKRMILVEDPFSSMAIGKEGTAGFGTRLSDYQLSLILQSNAEELVIIWDLDAYEKSQKLGSRLSDLGLIVRVGQLLDARDPDELNEVERQRVIRNARAASLSGLLRSRLSVVASRVAW